MIKAYPKIFHLGTKYIADIFDDEVYVEEKVDGSQASFAKINGELIFRSKGKIHEIECPDKLFKSGTDYLLSIKDDIPEGFQFYCEYMRVPKHNTLAYTRNPKNHFVLFGVYDRQGDTFIFNREKMAYYADMLGIDMIPTLYKGKIDSVEEVKKLLETESYLGGQKIEGVVVKNYNREVLVGGQVLPLMTGKYVSEEFKEVHQKNWKKENTGRGKWDVFKEKYKSEARWNKAIFYLRDQGELTDTPKDIGKLMKRVQEDITEECKEEIKEFLWKEFGQELLKRSTHGLPEFYKEKLLGKFLK